MVVRSTYNLNTKSGGLSNVIFIDNNLVTRVPSNKCLGVLLDEKLTSETHIEYICKKACAGIRALRRIKLFVPLCTFVTLYRSLIGRRGKDCATSWAGRLHAGGGGSGWGEGGCFNQIRKNTCGVIAYQLLTLLSFA